MKSSQVITHWRLQIVDPGSSCFIAIGLARKDYPKNRHPGWNKGSIAYHADDGKVWTLDRSQKVFYAFILFQYGISKSYNLLFWQVFVGSGVGAPFGPRCHKGDVMGCGVLFPRNYECKSDSEEELEQQGGVDQYGGGWQVIWCPIFLALSQI